MLKIFVISICAILGAIYVYGQPLVIPTSGEIWPVPKHQIKTNVYSIIRPSLFTFKLSNHDCDILKKATLRYATLIRKLQMKPYIEEELPDYNKFEDATRVVRNYSGYLDWLQINLTMPCATMPHLDMDESYTLVHKDRDAVLESNTIWGVLRGLESFSQMLVPNGENRTLRIMETEIYDEPRFSHRGLLIDTARHYLNILTIYRIIDGMAYNKLNVLHWHIVDDQSFPYESIAFPELSGKGAYHPTMTYTQKNISNIIEYARIRGIRVMPEFDMPGHTRSWGASHPEILTNCCQFNQRMLGPMNPTVEETYDFLQTFLKEIVAVFPEKHTHLGGDEISFNCWATNRKIRKFMVKQNMTHIVDLEKLFLKRVGTQMVQLNASLVVWQEVFENGVPLPQSTVVQIWYGDEREYLSAITATGLKALLSKNWYLDDVKSGGDWEKYYRVDPHDFPGSLEQKKLVIGGEACMWGELVDDSNIIQRIFPKVSAVAERLWSYFKEPEYDIHRDFFKVTRRLEEHSCRMLFRGIPCQPPNGPGYCI